ncbi:MAG: alpha/beta hydrolase [Anaerolineales bacterium]|nr:alpha/beta hydrolase [Anaerolineales bacterium]
MNSIPLSNGIQHTIITTNGINLHVVQAGDPKGKLVILLHGFPEFWYGWRKQIPRLASAGYRVWVPDQRGYNLSAKPKGLPAYSLNQLAGDVIGLIDAAGVEQALLVGHDWGAAVAWWTAQNYPERISRMVVMNVPHGLVMKKHLRSSLSQLEKSWYMFFFQIPWIPELLIRAQNWKIAARTLVGTSERGAFSKDDIFKYKQAWSQPGAIQALLNWYRALLRRPARPINGPRIKVPTLLIWGAQDRFLGREMAHPSIEFCDQGKLIFIEEATHWVQHEASERVNQLIVDFFCEPKQAG